MGAAVLQALQKPKDTVCGVSEQFVFTKIFFKPFMNKFIEADSIDGVIDIDGY